MAGAYWKMSKRYHFIGIGGIGMSGIALLLLRVNSKVSGSDLKESKATEELRALGAKIFIGHDAGNIEGADIVVYSSAIKEDNPEFAAAKKKGILIKRAEALALLMQDKTVITVTGSHGKTTTTSLVSCMLLEAGLNPTAAIGGILRNTDNNAFLGSGDYFVAEADESDGSFLYYRPKYSIITNIDREHLDYYKTFERELEAFREFIGATDRNGCIFVCGDDKNLTDMARAHKGRHVTFGLHESCDIYPKNIAMNGLSSDFDCFKRGKLVGRFHLALAGRHNISNSLAVIALGLELGISVETIIKSLASYKGAKRRLEIKYRDADYLVIDDYAHHPTEIRATLEAAGGLRAKRLIAIFQPHRYTRTQLLMEEFSRSFDAVDYLFITDIYAASEPPIEGVNSQKLLDLIKTSLTDKKASYYPKEKIAEHIMEIIVPGDMVITIGAGDIVKLSDELAERLKNKD
jgi:UDP-N-acetylmuramate--alanine ligase